MKIIVLVDNLRLRDGHTTSSYILGYAKKGPHNYSETYKDKNYTWYHIETGWIAGVQDCVEEWEEPKPSTPNKDKDQVIIQKAAVNIRYDASTSSMKMGVFESDVYYDVQEILNGKDYTWYKVGEHAYMAGVKEVDYLPKDTPRDYKVIRENIAKLKNSLSMADRAIENKKCVESYEELSTRVVELDSWIKDKFNYIEFDYEDDNEYNEIDVLYTTDIHGYWKGYCESSRVVTNFDIKDLATYREKLKKQGIPALIVNCGDIIHGSYKANENKGEDAIKAYNDIDMFASVFGNHEFRYDHGQPGWFGKQVPKIESITACNLFKDGKLVFKPYRLARFGSKTIGFIGVGFPGIDGMETSEYEVLTDDRCYAQIQKYIDELRSYGINYICCLVHLGDEPDDRSGGKITVPNIVANTEGLTMIFPGHSHSMNGTHYEKDKLGRDVMVAAQPRCDLMYISRVRLINNNMSSELLTQI